MEIYDYWKKTLNLDKKYKLKGFSRGALKTGFMLLPCKIFLDCGIPSPIIPNAILITHSHQDHIDALYSNIMNATDKVIIVATHTLINNLKDYLNACKSFNCGFKCKFTKWTPVSIIEEVIININNTNYLIKSYYLDHEVECIAYGLSEIINNKTELTYSNEDLYSIILFCGDMNYTSLETLPFEIYPYVIIECTFLNEIDIDEARQKKHLHITDLLQYFEKYPLTNFILIHFSCKYTKMEIKEYLSKYNFSNVIYWI